MGDIFDFSRARAQRGHTPAIAKLVIESELSERPDMIARVKANVAQADAFFATPRGRFVQACGNLASLGYETTADRATFAYRGGEGLGRGFRRLDLIPDPASLGAAFAVLASVSQHDPMAHRQARAAVAALIEIAGLIEPPLPTQPECA